MPSESLLRSIVLYLKTHKPYLFSPVNVIENDDSYSLYFTYLKTPVEIRVYNSQFVKVKVNDELTDVCCCMDSIREAIDNLQRLRFAYER